ncbi:16S rRNA (uracil(1498)-N(3))-methyltransferase [Niallia sp. Krafla_26]|uniref:16S rRNA (uracil(1498)-N(3))-methyltransferase n=1 Tax=Niallia sp. Krafla_26 TaxID=3064703 RepID=UPI003D178464
MQRYFVPFLASKDQFEITEEDFKHIVKVMRMKEDDEIICVTEDHKTALCKITNISTEQVTVQVVQWMKESVELPIDVTIVSGLPKGDKLDLIIQKGTELGAYKFIPFIAARSIVKWDEKKADKKISRWQKIAKEAAEQSHRSLIPRVENPASIQSLIDISESYDVKLIAYEEDSRLGEIKNLVKSLQSLNEGGSLLVVFGPEGGLTTGEVEKFLDNGFVSCGLGPRILRTETAPLYLLSAVSYQLELLR